MEDITVVNETKKTVIGELKNLLENNQTPTKRNISSTNMPK